MAKKSLARLQRDAEKAAAEGKSGGKAGKKAAPPDWGQAIEINNHIKEILDSVEPAVVEAKTRAESGMGSFAANPVNLANAFDVVERDLSTLRKQQEELKAKIGDRTGKISDPNVAMEVLDIYIKHQEVASSLDTTFRPNLAILQEQVIQASSAQRAAYEEQQAKAAAQQPAETAVAAG